MSLAARSNRISESNLQKPVRVLAIFFHGSIKGKHVSGSVRRFLEVSGPLSKAGVTLFTLEFLPPLPRPSGLSGQSFGLPGGWEPISLNRLAKILRLSLFSVVLGRRLRCEVVYAPDTIEEQLIPSFFASFLLRKPLVVVVHSVRAEEVRISLKNLFKSELKAKHGKKIALAKTIFQTLMRMGYRRTSAFLAVSRPTAKLVAEEFHPRQVVVSGNAVDDDWFELPSIPKTQDACYLGTISPEKRQELLIRAWKEISVVRPDARLVLVGGSEGRRYRNHCMGLIHDLGLEKNVIMRGFVNDAEARSLVSSSRIFVSSSSWEGFGLSVLEAMAAGIPCVLSDIPAFRDIFGEAALLVESSDPHAWAVMMLGLLQDNEKMEMLSESGKRLASKFSWEAVGRKEAELIRTLADPSRRSLV